MIDMTFARNRHLAGIACAERFRQAERVVVTERDPGGKRAFGACASIA
jgi:hypothetical protein